MFKDKNGSDRSPTTVRRAGGHLPVSSSKKYTPVNCQPRKIVATIIIRSKRVEPYFNGIPNQFVVRIMLHARCVDDFLDDSKMRVKPLRDLMLSS